MILNLRTAPEQARDVIHRALSTASLIDLRDMAKDSNVVIRLAARVEVERRIGTVEWEE